MLTVDILNSITRESTKSTVAAAYSKQFVDDCNKVLPQYGIKTKKELAMFLCNILHETGNLRVIEENLRYTTAERLMAVWPSRFKTKQQAAPYVNNPQKLANNVYANRMGNGNQASGDGWRYRGRSYPQLTGKDAYAGVGKIIGLDLVKNPDLLLDRKYGVLCAAGFWKWKGIKVGTATTVRDVCLKWNGGTNGLAERQKIYNSAMKFLSDVDLDVAIRRGDRNDLVKAAQAKLNELGYGLDADGQFGIMTRDAIMAFQADNNIPTTVDYMDREAYDFLMTTEKQNPTKELLEDVTEKELKDKGSEPIKQADVIEKVTIAGGTLGAIKGVTDIIPSDVTDKLNNVSESIGVFKSIMVSIGEIGAWALDHWWIVLIAIAIVTIVYTKKIKKTTVKEYQEGVRNKV